MGGEFVVFDLDELNRVFGLRDGFGDHHRHQIADYAYPVGAQCRAVRRKHGFVVFAFHVSQAMQNGKIVGCGFFAGKDGDNAGGCFGGRCVDGDDLGVGVRRAEKLDLCLAVDIKVVGITTLSSHQANVFFASNRLADPKFSHDKMIRSKG